MNTRQRYISDELTHFVGKSLKDQDAFEESQYELLKEILKSGRLKPHENFPDGLNSNVIRRLKGRLSDNTAYYPSSVCFCDIPQGDLALHIEKYSRFGVAFLKSFLIEQGANPLFYISNNSVVHKSEFQGNAAEGAIRRSLEFDRFVEAYEHLERLLWSRIKDKGGKSNDELAQVVWAVLRFLDFNVFAYLKTFDDTLPEEHGHNYYMEREWRVLGNVSFGVTDVRRIVLPEEFSLRLRRDFPDYTGQVTFAPP